MLFKFIKNEWLKEFFSSGSIKLGTVYDFKDVIEHGVSRGDESEGEHNIVRNNEDLVTLDSATNEPIISEIFKINENASCQIIGGKFIVPRRSADGLIFCASYTFSESLFREWNKSLDLDACYEIHDLKGFVNAINEVIESSAFFSANANITYTEKEIDFRSPESRAHPVFTKYKAEYSWQCENRSLWGVRGPCGAVKPWVIYAPEARKFCKPYAYLKNGRITYERV